MAADDAQQMKMQNNVAETRELLRTHFRKAKEAHEIASQHDEMVQKLALELAELEAEAKTMAKDAEDENNRPQTVSDETPSFVNRGLLFTHESRDVDLEFQKLSLDLSCDLAPATNNAVQKIPKTSNKNSPNSKYLLTDEDNECLSFFENIMRGGSDDSGSERSCCGSAVSKTNGQVVFHSAATRETLLPELSGSPEVFLHVYTVAELSGEFHSFLSSFGTGAYHVGVEVYGKEWSYCQDPLPGSGTGIDMLRVPKNHPAHLYEETVPLGATSLSPAEVKALLVEFSSEWKAVDYNALRRNCVSFAEKLCERLHVSAPPSRFGSLTKGLKMFLFA